jgi:S-adenosylmethionine:tRNA ribosyltransferase-isomerase
MSSFTKDYFYPLSQDRIAQSPVNPRDSCKLMVLHRKTQEIEHAVFTDLPRYLRAEDVLVFNDSKVMHARCSGYKVNRTPAGERSPGGVVEVFLLEKLSQSERKSTWECIVRSSARQNAGFECELHSSKQARPLKAVLLSSSKDSEQGTVQIEFEGDPLLYGELPLPSYIERQHGIQKRDESEYQTIYAKSLGSSAAPTAGLHFTEELLEQLSAKQIRQEYVTLHVGLGTFRPVKVADVRDHSMHTEKFEIASSVAERLNQSKTQGSRIIAVGTTSVRTLESAWDSQKKKYRSGLSSTQIFFYPGGPSRIQSVDAMITNFHLPESTLLMLVSSFAGREFVLRAYQEAVENEYRFYSYGDAMLIL